MQQGGGIGHDFLDHPTRALVKGRRIGTPGPLTFMDCWDPVPHGDVLLSRRGAMMATMPRPSGTSKLSIGRNRIGYAAADVQHVRPGHRRFARGLSMTTLDWRLHF